MRPKPPGPPAPALQREDLLSRGAGQVPLRAWLHDLGLPGLLVWGGRELVPSLEQDLLSPSLHLPGRHHPRQHQPSPLLLQAGRHCAVLLSPGLEAGGQASPDLWQEGTLGCAGTEVLQNKEGMNLTCSLSAVF